MIDTVKIYNLILSKIKTMSNSTDKKNIELDGATARKMYATADASVRQLLESNFKKEFLEGKNDPLYFQSESDVYKHLNCNPDKDVLNVDGFDEGQLKVVRAVIKKMRVCEAYNGRKKLLITDKRFYNWYVKSSAGAGLVFDSSFYIGDDARLNSAARLSFGTQAHLDDARKKFPDLDLDIIDLK